MNRQSDVSPTTWLITDGKIGDRVQCSGVAKALNVAYREIIVSPGLPWGWIMPYGSIPWQDRPHNPHSPIAPPFPELIIGSGRRAVAYLRYLKACCQDKLCSVILKDPRLPADIADIIWVPEHDSLRGENVIVTLTSPHGITQADLESARSRALPQLSGLPRPRITIILGDPTAGIFQRKNNIERLKAHISRLAKQVGSFMLTPSRRTPASVMQAVIEAIGAHPAWIDTGNEQNPYQDMLAHADGLLVTGDSHNMVSESLITGRPVWVFRPRGNPTKLAQFLNRLEEKNLIKTFDGHWEPYSCSPVNATVIIASEIRARLLKQQKSPPIPISA